MCGAATLHEVFLRNSLYCLTTSTWAEELSCRRRGLPGEWRCVVSVRHGWNPKSLFSLLNPFKLSRLWSYRSVVIIEPCLPNTGSWVRRWNSARTSTSRMFAGLHIIAAAYWSLKISLQQTLYPSSFPITPRAVTQNYLRSILYLLQQTKAWECFQSQRGEASWDLSWHLLFPSPCHTTKGAEGCDADPGPPILNQWQITWECITPCYPNTIRSHRP